MKNFDAKSAKERDAKSAKGERMMSGITGEIDISTLRVSYNLHCTADCCGMMPKAAVVENMV